MPEVDRPRAASLRALAPLMRLCGSVEVRDRLLNVPEIESVVLLWNGRQLETFAGHLDTTLPLRSDRDLVRRSG